MELKVKLGPKIQKYFMSFQQRVGLLLRKQMISWLSELSELPCKNYCDVVFLTVDMCEVKSWWLGQTQVTEDNTIIKIYNNYSFLVLLIKPLCEIILDLIQFYLYTLDNMNKNCVWGFSPKSIPKMKHAGGALRCGGVLGLIKLLRSALLSSDCILLQSNCTYWLCKRG